MNNQMIPKKIHYFWFGKEEKPESVKYCIDTWRKFCPEFEIIEWNESNYDIHKHPFMEKAYQSKKWAFVSDYARLDILYEYGGIYLDTDVEILKDLSPLCSNQAFIGFERMDMVNDGQGFGGVKGFPLFKEMRSCYDTLDDFVESPRLRTMVLKNHGLKLDGSIQNVAGMEIYPIDYFCPKNFLTGKLKKTVNTYSIHHYDASWHSKKGIKYIKFMRFLNRLFGEKKGQSIFQKLMKLKDIIRGNNKNG